MDKSGLNQWIIGLVGEMGLLSEGDNQHIHLETRPQALISTEGIFLKNEQNRFYF